MLTSLAAVASIAAMTLTPMGGPPIRGQGQCVTINGATTCTVVAEMPAKPAARGGGGGRAPAPRVAVPRGGPAVDSTSLAQQPTTYGPAARYLSQVVLPGTMLTPAASISVPCTSAGGGLFGCGPAAPPARAAAPTSGPVAPQISPEQLRQMAMDDLTLTKPHIQSAPCSGADCKGAVGVPAWFWIQQGDWTPQVATATAGTDSVTATATPTSVTWDLGDGTSITCDGPGTPYDQSKGWAESPDCGSKWLKAGSYTLTSTLHWTVAFTGSVNGTQDLTTTSTAPIEIGEYQVLVKGH